MNRKRDLYLLSEVYSSLNSRRWPLKSKWDYEDELQLKPKDAERLGVNPKEVFFAQADYDKEDHYDEGDGVYTPSSNWVTTEIFGDPLFFKENPQTGDLDIPITQEEEPELFKALYDALDEKIYEFEAGR
jgi:hypothetical protein